jgi:hypothetical protein
LLSRSAPALPLPPARPEVGCEIWCGNEVVAEIWDSEGEAPRSVLCIISKQENQKDRPKKSAHFFLPLFLAFGFPSAIGFLGDLPVTSISSSFAILFRFAGLGSGFVATMIDPRPPLLRLPVSMINIGM